MSLIVDEDVLALAAAGTLLPADFIKLIRSSLPGAWEIISGLAKLLETDSDLQLAVHAPPHMDDGTRGQLLRLLASSSMRAAVEQHFRFRLEFQNCHITAAVRLKAVGGTEHLKFISPESQVLAQRPDLVDC